MIPRTADAVAQAFDSDLLNGDGNNGTCIGLRNVPSPSTQTYTSTTPDAAGFLRNLKQLVRKVEVGGNSGHPVVILHPRRLSFLREKSATATSPIPVTWSPPTVPGGTVDMNGIHFIADSNVPTTISTTQDCVIVLRGVDMLQDIYASSPVVHLDYNNGSATMKVLVSVRRYLAASFARYATGFGIMTGPGLRHRNQIAVGGVRRPQLGRRCKSARSRFRVDPDPAPGRAISRRARRLSVDKGRPARRARGAAFAITSLSSRMPHRRFRVAALRGRKPCVGCRLST